MSPIVQNTQQQVRPLAPLGFGPPHTGGKGIRRCTVVTDHFAYTYLRTQTLLSRRKARRQDLLSRFEIEWTYKHGSTDIADPSSRIPTRLLPGTVLAKNAEGYVDIELDGLL